MNCSCVIVFIVMPQKQQLDQYVIRRLLLHDATGFLLGSVVSRCARGGGGARGGVRKRRSVALKDVRGIVGAGGLGSVVAREAQIKVTTRAAVIPGLGDGQHVAVVARDVVARHARLGLAVLGVVSAAQLVDVLAQRGLDVGLGHWRLRKCSNRVRFHRTALSAKQRT